MACIDGITRLLALIVFLTVAWIAIALVTIEAMRAL